MDIAFCQAALDDGQSKILLGNLRRSRFGCTYRDALGPGGVRPHPGPVIGNLESSVSGFCELAAKRAAGKRRNVPAVPETHATLPDRS